MKIGVILFLVLLVAILVTTAYATANSNERIVENLICQRIDTLNLYYSGNINKEDAIAKISKITMDFLREDDLENLKKYFQNYLNYPTGCLK